MDKIKTNPELINEFLDDVQVRGWSSWSIKSCGYSIKMLQDQIEKSFTDVDLEDLKSFFLYLQDRPGQRRNTKLSPEAIRKHINNLASFFEFLEFEDYISRTPIPKFRRRYLNGYLRKNNGQSRRQLITVEQMSTLINTILDPQEKAILCLLAKTGIRVSELISIDVDDIDWLRYAIKLKQTGKRHESLVYFDNETTKCIQNWLRIREQVVLDIEMALFIYPRSGKRISYTKVNYGIKKHASRIGIHSAGSTDLDKKFTAHCCRHWFTTHIRRSGMPREYIKELRGDSRNETIDIYDHIDEDELRQSYLTHTPQLGI